MEPTEIFKISFKHLLEKRNVTQVKIAEHIGVSPRSVNDYFGARVNYSEHRRQRIANFFGKTYLEMLNLGHQLTTGSDPIKQELPVVLKDVVSKLGKLDQKDLKLVDELVTRLSKK
ncbi:helix-turn-helix transcriptional regulator [Desulfobacula sp.]|uniref:helix-turn-helix domain-containing protein n=1 Tax=Desulfobacula sp. TaxID=2593537 RepID=UPI0026102B90|nr:helix-turn-helix transcriptional regulator [Desulfobacula sp.]